MLEAVRGLLKGKVATAMMVADEASCEAAARMEPDLVVLDLSLPVSGNVNSMLSLCVATRAAGHLAQRLRRADRSLRRRLAPARRSSFSSGPRQRTSPTP
jgi:hypothetical protein